LPAFGNERLPIFDSEVSLNRLAGERQLTGEVLKAFLQGVPSQLNILRERTAEFDGSGALVQAQALKTGAATVYADGLSAIAVEMEQAAVTGAFGGFDDLLSRAAEEFERLKSSVENASKL
jgi:HPt (histidine-containing phosphotransfer) domain-containing protein